MKKAAAIGGLLCLCIFCTGMAFPSEAVQTGSEENPEIVLTYELSPEESPKQIIQKYFDRDEYRFSLRDIHKEAVTNTVSKMVSEAILIENQEKSLEENLKLLDGSKEYDQDGFTGILTLVPSSVKTEAAGYETRSYTVSDTKTYLDLPYNDPGLLPTSVTKNGLTLVISDVTWKGEGGTGANGSLIPTSYTATVNYSGTGSSRYATGYVTTAEYSGVVSKTEVQKNRYTVTYEGKILESEEVKDLKNILPLWLLGVTAVVVLGTGAAFFF